MSQPAENESTGDKENLDGTDRKPSTQAEAAETDADANLDNSLTEKVSEISSQPQYGDRNPNWTDHERPKQNSQESCTDAEQSEKPQHGNRNPNWTDRDLPKQNSQERDAASKEATEKQGGDRNSNWQDRESPPPE